MNDNEMYKIWHDIVFVQEQRKDRRKSQEIIKAGSNPDKSHPVLTVFFILVVMGLIAIYM